jgi:hypothetical protein
MASSASMSTFRELAPAKIAEIKSELQALEKSSSEVQRYKILCDDLRDWERALGPPPAPPPAPGTFSNAWPAELIPVILEERGAPMTRKELKHVALSRGVRTPGSDPDSDLDRFLSHARNYAESRRARRARSCSRSGPYFGDPEGTQQAMTPEALTDRILPERTKKRRYAHATNKLYYRKC